MGTRLDPNLDAVIKGLPSHFDISVQNTTKYEVQKNDSRTDLTLYPALESLGVAASPNEAAFVCSSVQKSGMERAK